MCQPNYQSNCYDGCPVWKKCNHHKLIVCDHCGKRIQPGELRKVGLLNACSVICVHILERKEIPALEAVFLAVA